MNSTNDVGSPQQNSNIWGIVIPILIISVIALFAFLFFSRLGSTNRLIKPFEPTQTPSALQVEYAPIAIEFADLGEDPLLYRDQRVQITGRFSKIELPNCVPFSGPQIEWGLIHDALQMNAIGYERIVRSLPENTQMTVEGVWTFYEGGVGCGKESTEQNGVWYLKVEHIISPNPILAGAPGFQVRTTVGDETESGETTPTAEATMSDGENDNPIETVSPTTDSGENLPPTSTPTQAVKATLTPTSNSASPDATSTPPPTPGLDPTEEATSEPGSTETPVPTATATAVSEEATHTPQPTATAGSIGNPPAPTATPGDGYPPPGGGGGYP